jgi:hypothetical protein
MINIVLWLNINIIMINITVMKYYDYYCDYYYDYYYDYYEMVL